MNMPVSILHQFKPVLVEVEQLRVRFGAHGEDVVKGISFQVREGECLAIVGESGSGKSVTARSLLGLAGEGAQVRADSLRFGDADLAAYGERQWRALRGDKIGLVMQDALNALDPMRTLGREVGEPLDLHRKLTPQQRVGQVQALLESAGMPDAAQRLGLYPHQLSGGLRQRALIASAIACGPRLLIADEPTTALDAAVQAQVLALLQQLRNEGHDVIEAVRLGSMQRLRTVLMTAMLAALGLLPMALSHEIGSETQRPLAIVVIGGLFTATLLTLVVLPALYVAWFGPREGKSPQSRKKPDRPAGEPVEHVA